MIELRAASGEAKEQLNLRMYASNAMANATSSSQRVKATIKIIAYDEETRTL